MSFAVLVMAAADGRQRLAAANFAGQPAPAQRAPDHRANFLIERQRHQLPFEVAADERIISLMGHVARPAVAVGHGQRFHQMPARKVRAADVANLAGPDQSVQRVERFLDGRQRVEPVKLIQIDVVGSQPAQAGLERFQQVKPRRADIVWSRSGAKRPLGRQEHPIATAFDRLSQYGFGVPFRVNVGRVEHVQPGLERDVDHAVASATPAAPHALKS